MNKRIKNKIRKRGGFKSYDKARIKLLRKASHMFHRFGVFISLSDSHKNMNFSKASLMIGKDGKMRLRYHNKRKRRKYN